MTLNEEHDLKMKQAEELTELRKQPCHCSHPNIDYGYKCGRCTKIMDILSGGRNPWRGAGPDLRQSQSSQISLIRDP